MRDLEAYIEGLTIGQGRHAGQFFELLPWERRFLRGAFSQPDDAALTIARANGKSTFVSAIAAACVDVGGPLVEPGAESMLVASSFDQGLINFRHIQNFLRPTFEKHEGRFRVQDSANRASIQDRETGAMLRVVGSDPRRLHGGAPKLLLLDELAQWPGTQIDAMLAALETSRGKIPGSKALWIGTQPDSTLHPFSKALSGGVGYSQIHAAGKSDGPFQVRTWRKANPSWGHLPDLQGIIRQEAERAKRDPASLQTFRALRLNQGTSDKLESTLLDADVWERIESDPNPAGRYVLGLDLSTTGAMTAAAAYFPESRALEALGVFPELPDLRSRGLSDGVGRLYVQMADRGEVIQAGRRVVDVGAMLAEVLKRWGRPAVIVADRYREAELRQELEKARFPLADFVLRGMGFRDGAEDVRAFRTACLDDKVRPSKSLLLRSAMSEARTVGDPAGNEKLSKGTQGGRRLRSRDDAAAASILAIAEGTRRYTGDTGRAARLRYVIA